MFKVKAVWAGDELRRSTVVEDLGLESRDCYRFVGAIETGISKYLSLIHI